MNFTVLAILTLVNGSMTTRQWVTTLLVVSRTQLALLLLHRVEAWP